MSLPRASFNRLPVKSRARANVSVGAMLYVKRRTIPELTVELDRQLSLPEGLRRSQRIRAGELSGARRARGAARNETCPSVIEDASAAPICLWVADFFEFERVAPNSALMERLAEAARWK
jgi:hypothetical protein